MHRADGTIHLCSSKAVQDIISADKNGACVLFYDLVRSYDNKFIIGIAPSARHYKDITLQCYRYKQKVPMRMTCATTHASERIFKIRLPANVRPDQPFSLTICCSNQTVDITVPPNPFLGWKRCDLLQQTMQKDYPDVWIKDHCLFYHRVHGCQRILFYDNASTNRDNILSLLSNLDANLEIILVNWPVSMMFTNMNRVSPPHPPAQIAAYAHGFYLFNHLADFMMHFDLDEYLCNRSGMPLVKYMRKHTRLWPGKVVAQLPIVHIPEPNKQYPVRAAYFNHYNEERAIQFRSSFSGHKPFHRTRPALYGLRFLRPSVYRFYPGIHEIQFFRGSIYAFLDLCRRIATRLAGSVIELRPSKCLRAMYTVLSLRVNPEHLIFYHYRGIRTDWDHTWRDLPANQVFYQVRKYNPKKHVRTDEMSRVLARVGLADHSSD